MDSPEIPMSDERLKEFKRVLALRIEHDPDAGDYTTMLTECVAEIERLRLELQPLKARLNEVWKEKEDALYMAARAEADNAKLRASLQDRDGMLKAVELAEEANTERIAELEASQQERDEQLIASDTRYYRKFVESQAKVRELSASLQEKELRIAMLETLIGRQRGTSEVSQ